jgi:hypothetical protein
MKYYFSKLINKWPLKILKTIAIIGALYFFMSTYNWMVFEKYQMSGGIKGVSENVDKQLGLDKTTELSQKYKQYWIDSEKKYNNTLGVLCIIVFIGLKQFKQTDKM